MALVSRPSPLWSGGIVGHHFLPPLTPVSAMIDTDQLDEEVLDSILLNLGFDKKQHDAEHKSGLVERIKRMGVEQAFDRYLTWHGLIGWGGKISSALDNIRESETDEES